MFKRAQAHRGAWDFIIIGGGATGVGVAVDAASRGYRVLLLEQSDFGKGTSSRSTKLVHGGVRYLEQGNISLVMEALKERGLRVPDDIALVGFDDFEWAEFFSPRLTVIAQPLGELGAQAVELLLTRLEDPTLEPREVRLPATFVHRDSCGC